MKQNIYIFSNTILSRKNDSLMIETMPDIDAIHDVDIYETEADGVLLPAPKGDGSGNVRYIPVESVEALYTFGEVRFNTQFLRCVAYYGIPVHIFNYYGHYLGTFLPEKSDGDGKIQILQYQAYLDPERRVMIARAIIEASVRNIVANLRSYQYSGIALEDEIASILGYIELIRAAQRTDELMGYEGTIRQLYYRTWNVVLKQDVNFTKRIKHPPQGVINSLISFGNALLYGVCLSELYRTRLNPYVGFLHETGDEQHPLVYDLSEVFKPVVVDRVIFRTINLNILSTDDFSVTEKGMYLKENARRKFVEEFENRLSTVVHHKRLNRRISYRSLIRMECFNLLNFLTGAIKTYEPYRAG
ncbi:MAG: type I-B CRISPR-associated endonuclease Cas1b [Bacteroidetes bacterium]|nr:type I-B CRISPR-associated endonuclease Cas1b [Bacteroidota bacterium]